MTKGQGNGRGLVWGLVAAVVVGGALAVVIATQGNTQRGEDVAAPTPAVGASFGGGDVKAALWQRLSAYEGSYLASWEGAFKRPDPRASTVLKAFAKVMEQVTGPDGFWRDEVPNELLECFSNVDSQVCEGLEEAYSEFSEWDALAGQLDRLDGSRADVFLQRNHERLTRYLDTYVPPAADEAGMKRTAFYEQKLRRFVADK